MLELICVVRVLAISFVKLSFIADEFEVALDTSLVLLFTLVMADVTEEVTSDGSPATAAKDLLVTSRLLNTAFSMEPSASVSVGNTASMVVVRLCKSEMYWAVLVEAVAPMALT